MSNKFNPRSVRDCTVLLLALCAGFCITVELAARYVFPRVSRVRHRIQSEQKAALQISGVAGRPTVLFVGNSLFERGIDVPMMQQELPDFEVRRFVVSDTAYLDWYYGLRRLFSEGAHPQVVVLGLSERNLVSQHFEGDLSAYLMVRTADVIPLGRDLHKDNTALSNLYFSNLSAFYGSRTQFRKWLLTMAMPDVETLAAALRPKPSSEATANEITAAAAPRLQALNALCIAHGATLVFVVPPVVSSDTAGISGVEEAGNRAGVAVLSPIQPGELGPEYFRDGLHLTDAGAAKFTSSLSAELQHALPTSSRASLY